MSAFLLVFFLLYGGIHIYFFRKLRVPFALHGWPALLVGALLLLMVLAPLLVRLAEREGLETTGLMLAMVGYTWMGFIFLFVSFSVAVDMYHFLLWICARIFNADSASLFLSPRTRFLLPFAWGCVISIYGAYEARAIRVERVEIVTPKLPPGARKLTLVQISDVHLGLMVRHGRVADMIEIIRQADPDLVVSTGDFVDGQLDGLTDMAQRFSQIRPRYGKYAITGNHEIYAGLRPSLLLTEEAKFQVLRNAAVQPVPGVVLAGVDDPAVARHGASGVGAGNEQALLAQLTDQGFIILLKHRPVVDPASRGKFDLQLSGHVHKGQIFPFNLLTHLSYPVRTGLSTLESGAHLYVSRGTGTWGPPIRFLAPPEITVIELIPAPADK